MTYPQEGLPPLISRRLLEGHMDLPYGTLPEPVVQSVVHGSSGAVRSVCGWRLDYEVVTDYAPKVDGSKLALLPTAHLLSVESVRVDGEELTPWSVGVSQWDYHVLMHAAALKRDGSWYWPHIEGALTVDFTHGYAINLDEESGEEIVFSGLPYDLEAIILSVAERSIDPQQRYSNLKVGGITEGFAGTNIPTNFILSKAERHQLAPYIVEV